MNAYLEIHSEHAQFSKNAKIAAVIVPFCPLTELYRWVQGSAFTLKVYAEEN